MAGPRAIDRVKIAMADISEEEKVSALAGMADPQTSEPGTTRPGTRHICTLPPGLGFAWPLLVWCSNRGHRRTATAVFAGLRLLGCIQRRLEAVRAQAASPDISDRAESSCAADRLPTPKRDGAGRR